MNTLVYIAILPVVGLLSYIYNKDQHKEPTNVLAKTFAFGVLIIFPAIFLELFLEKYFPTKETSLSLIRLFFNVFIGVAVVEEMLKWLIVKLSVYKDKNFDESFDGIIYAVFASLGFGCLENIMYVFSYGVGTGIFRAITAVPLHACTGVIMGYFIGKAKLKKGTSDELAYIFLSMLIPTTVHAIYDFLLTVGKVSYVVIWLVFTILVYIICFVLIKKSTSSNVSFETKTEVVEVNSSVQTSNSLDFNNIQNSNVSKDTTISIESSKGKYCTKCGTLIGESNFCPNCGTKNEL